MSAHADKTLHWKISGNINDTDTFPHIFSLETYSSGMNLWTNFSRISFMNLSTNSYEFFARKIGYVTNGLYCSVSSCSKSTHLDITQLHTVPILIAKKSWSTVYV